MRKIGIEIEFYAAAGQTAETIFPVLGIPGRGERFDRNSSKNNHWSITTDGSIKDERGARLNGLELVSPPIEKVTDWKNLNTALQNLKKVPGFGQNATCALHIHVDISDFSMEKKKFLFDVYKKIETEIMASIPRPRRENRYCQPLAKANWAVIEQGIKDGNIEATKYYSLRFNTTIPTAEFRMHPYTTNYAKIGLWAVLCESIVGYAKNSDVLPERIEDVIGISGKQYLEQRKKGLKAPK